MSAYERAFQPSEYERFLFLIWEQGNTLAILIEEYTRASGIAFAMLKNKIYYILSTLEPLLQGFMKYLSEGIGSSLHHYFSSMLQALDSPEQLDSAFKKYFHQIDLISGGNV